MQIKCLAQGSTGNCWVLDDGQDKLILDAGIDKTSIVRGIDYDLKSVKGVLITHQHSDHAKSSDELASMGLNVYKPYVEKKTIVTFGSYRVQCFKVPHNDTECYGFYIKSGEHRILYATDFEFISHNFKNVRLTNIIIECNYQNKYLNMDAENLSHKVLGHCELETCKEFIKANATDALKSVLLTHIGIGTADAKEMVNKIQKCLKTPCSVDYARPNQVYELLNDSCPF